MRLVPKPERGERARGSETRSTPRSERLQGRVRPGGGARLRTAQRLYKLTLAAGMKPASSAGRALVNQVVWFELHFTDRAVVYSKYAGGFLRREPGGENGGKDIVWPEGEMTVA